MTYRRLTVLLRGLPRDSAYSLALVGDRAQWGAAEHLMATVVDELRLLRHVYVQAHNKQKLPWPKLVDRPGYETPEIGVKRYRGAPMPLERLKALREQWRNGRGGDDGR